MVNTPKKRRANFLRTNTQATNRVGPKSLVTKKRRFTQLVRLTLQSRVMTAFKQSSIPTTTRPPAIAGTTRPNPPPRQQPSNGCKSMNKPRPKVEKAAVTSLPLVTRRAPRTPPPDTPPRHLTPARNPCSLPAQYTHQPTTHEPRTRSNPPTSL